MAPIAQSSDSRAAVIAFPRQGRVAGAPGPDRPAAPLVATLRVAARDLQVTAPLDLDRLAATGCGAAPAALWARALIETAGRGARLVFHRQAEPMVSATECWLASLVAAVAKEDAASAAFLTHRFLAKNDRRLAVCFAGRLAEALEARRAA